MEFKKLIFFIFTTAVTALVGWVLMGKFGALVGACIGLLIPGVSVKLKEEARRNKFSSQLIDAILLISSCLKAGLSLNQAIEVLCQEMPAPMSSEFSTVLKSIRIGVTLEEAFVDLNRRVPLEELKFVCAAILVARETGGDLPTVLIRLVDTLRDRFRLKENIQTYTIQGKVQGIIMGIIPVVFVMVVLQQNPQHFDIMFGTNFGRFLIALCVVLQVIAVYVIAITSKIEV